MRVGFIMEQHIGHRTFYQNLRRYVALDHRIEPRWVEVSYHQENGWIERLKFIPAGLKGPLRGLRQARRGLRAIPLEAAFFNTQVPAVFNLDKLRSLPCVVATDITPIQYDAMAELYGHRPDNPGWIRDLKFRLTKLAFSRAAHIVAWSKWVRTSLIADYGVAENRITVIPPGINLDIWKPAAEQAVCESGPLKILFVGGDFTRKGGKVLLEAFSLLDRSKVELHLVTREPIAHVPGMNIYHGLKPNSPELIGLYRQSSIFVLPSLAEAFGIAAVEALGSGLPVIASRVGGLAEIVEDGKNGLLIPPGDPQALAEALLKLTRDEGALRMMRQEARRSAEARFDARENASRCISLVLNCVEGAR